MCAPAYQASDRPGGKYALLRVACVQTHTLKLNRLLDNLMPRYDNNVEHRPCAARAHVSVTECARECVRVVHAELHISRAVEPFL